MGQREEIAKTKSRLKIDAEIDKLDARQTIADKLLTFSAAKRRYCSGMKTMPISLLAVLAANVATLRAAEMFVERETEGQYDSQVRETRYFFEGEDCFGAQRAYWNSMRRAIRVHYLLDFYWNGELVATVNPAQLEAPHLKAPGGYELKKTPTEIQLFKDNKFVRVWTWVENEIKIASKEKLDQMNERKLGNPSVYAKRFFPFQPRIKAPTRKEAEKDMEKTTQVKPWPFR